MNPLLHRLPVITLIVGIIALLIAGYVLLLGRPLPKHATTQAMRTYDAPAYGLSFSYDPSLRLKDRDDGLTGRPQLSVVLIEDTPENVATLEGKSAGNSAPSETPPNISIDVYPNPDKLAAEDWVRADTTWTVRTSDAAPFGKGSLTGVTYSWDGLYKGTSYVITRGTHAYVFAVTWMTPSDTLLPKFEQLIKTVTITDVAATVSIEEYVRAHISDLSPEKAVLGGKLHVTTIEAKSGAGVVTYEDGHNSFTADFVYTTGADGAPSVTSFKIRK